MKGTHYYLIHLIASLIILSQLFFVAYGQQCLALDTRCGETSDVCCGEVVDATCVSPMYGLGFSRCRECQLED